MSWWSKHVTKNVSKAVRTITGNSKSGSSDSSTTSTPAVSVSAPAVAASTSESAVTESTVQGAAQTQNSRAKGKKKLTIDANNYNPLGL